MDEPNQPNEPDLAVSVLILDMLGNEPHTVDRLLQMRLRLVGGVEAEVDVGE